MAAPWSRTILRISSARICENVRKFKAINRQKTFTGMWGISSKRPFAAVDLKRRFSAVETRLCWRCSNEISAETLVCGKCGIIQNVDKNANYFKLFEIKQSFVINTTELANKFKALQTTLHPDKFVGKSKREREHSSECSSFLNAAYGTLLRPLDRGEYLLGLNGQEIGETGSEMDLEFLTEIMEINELLAETRPSGEELGRIDEENRRRTTETLELLTGAFDDDRLDEAKALLAKLKYYDNIEKKVKELEIESGIVR